MNAHRGAQLVTETCLREDLPLPDALRTFSAGPAQTASTGDLPRALRELGYDPLDVRVGKAWPAALGEARRLRAELPQVSAVRVPLGQAWAWFAVIAVIQLLVSSILSSKLGPVFGQIQADYGLKGVALYELAEPLLAITAIFLTLLAIFGAARLPWLPGWGRHLREADQASATAALLAAGAPPDVFGVWVREQKSIKGLGALPVADDLRLAATAAAQRSERAMQRFLILYRWLGYLLLLLVALAITVDVYEGCSMLAVVR